MYSYDSKNFFNSEWIKKQGTSNYGQKAFDYNIRNLSPFQKTKIYNYASDVQDQLNTDYQQYQKTNEDNKNQFNELLASRGVDVNSQFASFEKDRMDKVLNENIVKQLALRGSRLVNNAIANEQDITSHAFTNNISSILNIGGKVLGALTGTGNVIDTIQGIINGVKHNS